MADGEDSEEKSHEPTEKRKSDAREEGQILSSKEVFVFATLVGGVALLSFAEGMGPMLAGRWGEYFRLGDARDLDALLTSRLAQFWTEVLVGGLAFAIPLAVLVIGLQFAMGGINFAPKAIGFKFEKLDPIKGLGRMVSAQAAVELGKGLLKLVLLGALAWVALMPQLPRFSALAEAGPFAGMVILWGAIISLLWWLCLGLAGIGVLDFCWQFVSMRKKLMMSFKEMRDESKESNGSPEVKGRLRQMQMEAGRNGARQRAALDDVPQATAIITNPTHFAVALRYVPGETAAPKILAIGKGPMAQEIMARGRAAGVRVLQSPPLARALYFTGDIGAEINEKLFGAVAAVLAYIYRLDRGESGDEPEIALPPELRFDEFGRAEAAAHGMKSASDQANKGTNP